MKRRPSAELAVDGRSLTGPEAALLALAVSISASEAVDGAIVSLGRQSPVVDAAPGTPVRISLGYDGDNDLVLTGEIERVTQRPWGVRLEIQALPARLQRLRLGRSYLDQSPADIVADLAGEASVPTGDLVSSSSLAVYHVDERRNGWRHANDLARLAGAELSATPEGELSMTTKGGGTGGGLLGAAVSAVADVLGLGTGWRYGAELLDASISPSRSRDVPEVVPYGAASPLGGDKWHLLVGEPDGGPPSGPMLVPASLRDRDGAETYGAGLSAIGARSALTATVTLMGEPDVRAGDPVTVADWPHGDPDPLQVVAVEHQFSRTDGFTTTVSLEVAA